MRPSDALATAAAGSQPRLPEHLELPAVLALFVAGGGVGYLIVSMGGLGPNRLSETGEFRLWLFLITVQTGMWALAGAVFIGLLRSSFLVETAREARSTVVWAVGAAAVPIVGFTLAASLRSDLTYPLPHRQAKVIVLGMLGSAVALVGVALLAQVQFAFSHWSLGATKAGVESYLQLRAVLERVLGIEGAILGAAILAAGALRNVVVAWHNGDDSSFPPEYVLLWGAFFTLLMALLYAPIYHRIQETGWRMVEAVCPAQEPTSATWAGAYEKRKQVEEMLRLGVGPTASFRAGVAIAAPLLSSIVGVLLGAA